MKKIKSTLKDLKINTATEKDFSNIRDFYWQIIDMMDNSEYKPKWVKGVYPTDQFLRESIRSGYLYYVKHDSTIIGAMVLDHNSAPGYKKIDWGVEAGEHEITYIHILGVLPSFHRNGIAHFLVEKTIHLAKTNNQKAIRLDVLSGNLPAQKFYEKFGFEYRGNVELFYEDTGLTDFLLYEFIL